MHRLAVLCLVPGAFLPVQSALADNFGSIRYDSMNDQLVVTMLYRGTNADHDFSLKWGQCTSGPADDLPMVTVDVLDDQFQDRAQQNFKKTVRFGLDGLPCRPARVTLRTAPRFIYTLTIPARR